MRSTARVLGFAVVLLACDATGAHDGDTEGDGSTGTASATGITTTGPVTSADGGGTSGDPPPPGTSCEMCIYGWCGEQLDTCLGDDACSCWLGCTETMSDEQCAGLCGDPGGPLIELYECLLRYCVAACEPGETGESETGESETSTGTTTGPGDSTGDEGDESTETTQ